MSVKPLDSGGWEVDVRPQGRYGKRFRKKFDKKGEAQQYERWLIANYNNKDWIEKPADRRRLSELIDLWFQYYGNKLKSSRSCLLKLKKMDRAMNHPTANQINNTLLTEYRAARSAKGISEATLSKEHFLLSSVFSVLIESGHYQDKNPIRDIKAPRVKKPEMIFLTMNEIREFLSKLTGENLKVVRFLLSTGGRWGEAKYLKQHNIINCKATFVKTKNSLARTVPVSPEIYNELKSDRPMIFDDVDYKEIRNVLKETIPHLPKGQAIHVLRHTFASHFMMNGGNILALQKILGHSKITQTMIYAHLAPDYLIDAVKFNPVNNLMST
ncbi:phage integrase [Pragia fontium]|uniref:Site-specific recombinase XerD n=1 Tax=Pragia fontium DSM 5563 = ATCC 49100 TaxID=1122977 RepID=A0AAJ4W9G7_9GAMM|nr:tyrosine-type recombinase/integrase [Pragia fontium]SFC48650.1 Site-specific recombinase XerD [Pragia fontium DSM 5563 = ATCC 49100]